MKNKVISFRNNKSERLCWVRLEGITCNLYIIYVCVPHSARVKPCQADTLKEMDAAIKNVPKGDYIIVLGDFNEELPSRILKHTAQQTRFHKRGFLAECHAQSNYVPPTPSSGKENPLRHAHKLSPKHAHRVINQCT